MDEQGTMLIVGDDSSELLALAKMPGQSEFDRSRSPCAETALTGNQSWVRDGILLDCSMPDIDLQSMLADSVAFSAKPFLAEELIGRVKAQIENSRRTLEQRVELARFELAQSESRNRVLFADSPLALIVYDPVAWRVLEVNAACIRLLGYAAEKWVAQPLGFALESGPRAALYSLARKLSADSNKAAHPGLLRFYHHDGHWLETEGLVQHYDYPGCRAQILILRDASERRKTEEHFRSMLKEHRQQLELSVHYDSLTALPNRTLLDERMRQGLVQAQLTGCWMVVCYLDIDDFASLNASHGQEVGNHLLINTAECLRRCLRGGDTLVRIGSDEFALLVMGLKSEDEINRFLLDLQERLAEPFISDTATVTLSASIGVTTYPHDNADSDTLLRHALQAMILAKQDGTGLCRRFDAESDKRVRARREIIDNLRSALAAGEFVLHYQPKVDLKQMRVVGAEALIRWQHPVRGMLPPGAFLPAIEGDELMIDLGYWVVGEALAQMDRWREKGLDLAVSVNVAAQHLVAPGFVARLRKLLAEHPGTTRGHLEIEVLETSGLEDVARVEQVIVACRELGIGFSLDDFGTGYSSLTYLRRLSADTLKIDQTFVMNMMVDPGDKAIISGVIGLAAAFQRKVIAEGVETIAHARSLLGLGCVLAQGYGIARPMPAESLPGWVERWPDEAWRALGE
jgi:diguanylate cyclase (GGDEF)-like protein/PAS domain S-box-containing protein